MKTLKNLVWFLFSVFAFAYAAVFFMWNFILLLFGIKADFQKVVEFSFLQRVTHLFFLIIAFVAIYLAKEAIDKARASLKEDFKKMKVVNATI